MRISRRLFLKQLAGVVSVLLGGTQLAGCLGESDPPQTAQAGSSMTAAPTTQPEPSAPAAAPQNSGPIWQPSPTIEFVEGVPAVMSVSSFVRDPDSDPLVIALESGALIPGITWDPSRGTIAYDGRPLGASADTPVVVSGLTFTADDRK